MEIWHQIKTSDGWITTDTDTYEKWKGEKRLWGPTHGTALIQKYLQPLRWM